MRSKVSLGVLGLGLIFFLSGCMLLPPETGLSQRSLVPLANETLSQTLELPEVQDLIGRLEAEGYTPPFTLSLSPRRKDPGRNEASRGSRQKTAPKGNPMAPAVTTSRSFLPSLLSPSLHPR